MVSHTSLWAPSPAASVILTVTEVCTVHHLAISDCWIMWTVAFTCYGRKNKQDRQYQPLNTVFDFITELQDSFQKPNSGINAIEVYSYTNKILSFFPPLF